MRIALIQSFLPSRSHGGVGHFTHQFANHLVMRRHEVIVFSLDPAPADAQYSVLTPPETAWFVRGRLGRLYGFGVWCGRQDYSAFDLVHAMGDSHLIHTKAPVIRTLSGSALAEALHARQWRTRVMYLSLYPFELLSSLRASVSIGISRVTINHFPPARMVIHEGVDLRVFRPGGEKATDPTILSVGHRLHDRKRLDLIVDAFQSVVLPVLPHAKLWLVCDEQVNAPGVRCLSRLPVEELACLYRRAWVFCLASSYEGFGRPYAEALASGTAVVSTANAGALEVLDGGRYGVLTSERELGSTLLTVLRDNRRRCELAHAGLLRARDFDWIKVVDQYESLYKNLLETSARGRIAS